MLKLTMTLLPRRRLKTDIALSTEIELDADYYDIGDLIEWVNHALETNENVEFLTASGESFYLDTDLYDRVLVEESN